VASDEKKVKQMFRLLPGFFDVVALQRSKGKAEASFSEEKAAARLPHSKKSRLEAGATKCAAPPVLRWGVRIFVGC
jgi:hypothetical protein